jgi:hypothetical protein
MKNYYYYKRHASGSLGHRHLNTNKNTTSVEAIAFIATVGVMLAMVIFNVWVNGVH